MDEVANQIEVIRRRVGADGYTFIVPAVNAELEARAADVRASMRLTDSPSCLVSLYRAPEPKGS